MNEIAQKKLELRKYLKQFLVMLGITAALLLCFALTAHAAMVTVDLGAGENSGASLDRKSVV